MALGAIELMQDEALLIAAKAEFDEKRGGDYHYEALLGDRDPPLDYRE
jgi:aminobenzoyl-glutamate utilization protein B